MFHRSERLWSSLFRRPRHTAHDAKEHSRALARIEEWTLPWANPPDASTSVHVVTSSRDWRLTAWMLASWCHFTERTWSLVIHDDGTLTDEPAAKLQQIFPGARIIRRKEADAVLQAVLLAFPFCETFRSDDPSALKIFDARYFCTGERFFVFDRDVLFYNYPRELVDWAEGAKGGCWFPEASDEHSLVTPAEARDEFNIRIWPRADAGICLFQKAAIDLDFIDSALAQTSILRGSLEHAAQTLAMLCAARAGHGGLLPPRYEASRERRAGDDAVSRQYAGAFRGRFFDEGLKRVAPHLFVPEEAPR